MTESDNIYMIMSDKDLHDELERKQAAIQDLNRRKTNIETEIIGIKEALYKKSESDRKHIQKKFGSK